MDAKKREIIPRPLRFDIIRNVFLNKEGIRIGQIVKWKNSIAYFTWRRHPAFGARGEGHYYIKNRGFCVDKALLKNMIINDKVDFVIIEYRGPRGLKYFISSIDDWYMYGIDIAYSKDVDSTIEETYGCQKSLCEDYMDEFKVVEYEKKYRIHPPKMEWSQL